MSFDKLHDEFWKAEQAISRITGATPAFIRPPDGQYNDLFREVAMQRNQTLLLWDFSADDSKGMDVEVCKQRYEAIADIRPTSILTAHHENYSLSNRHFSFLTLMLLPF